MNPIRSIAASTLIAVATLLPTFASAGQTAATGAFTGANNHITTGDVSIVRTADGGAVVILNSNFNLDGAPQPNVGFGKDGEYVSATDLGDLSHNTGLQVFIVPASINIDDFNEIYIWCAEFDVSLGVAPLNKPSN
jgi:hypothetical protein